MRARMSTENGAPAGPRKRIDGCVFDRWGSAPDMSNKIHDIYNPFVTISKTLCF